MRPDPIIIPDYEELSIGHWRKFNPAEIASDPLERIDQQVAKASLYSGIPVETLNHQPVAVAETILVHVDGQLSKAMKGSEAFREALTAGSDWSPPHVVEFAGKRWSVPHDLDMDTTLAQWANWKAWEAPEHEADLVAECLAFLLVEEGEKYTGTSPEKHEEMRQCPIQLAFDLCAFFFVKNERFRNVTAQRSEAFRTSMNALLVRVLKHLPIVTKDSTS